MAIIDTGKLHNYWDHLSELCHMQIEPGQTWESEEWVEDHYKKLDEIDDYLATILNEDTTIGLVQLNSIPDQILEVRQNFMDLKIDEESMKKKGRNSFQYFTSNGKN